MNARKYDEVKREVKRLQSAASYLLKAADNLNAVVESVNPSNPVKRRKDPSLAELTQIELNNLITKQR